MRSEVTPCIKKGRSNTQPQSQLSTINWLRIQLLAQNSSPYLYNVNQNILSLLLGSHEDLWSSGALNYNNCYNCGRMKVGNIGKLLIDPEIVISSDHRYSNALLNSNSIAFCLQLFLYSLAWSNILRAHPLGNGRVDGNQLERWMPIIFVACSARSSCSLYISKYLYKPSYVSILRDMKP